MDLEAAHDDPRLCFWLKETITLRVANALQDVVKYRGVFVSLVDIFLTTGLSLHSLVEREKKHMPGRSFHLAFYRRTQCRLRRQEQSAGDSP